MTVAATYTVHTLTHHTPTSRIHHFHVHLTILDSLRQLYTNGGKRRVVCVGADLSLDQFSSVPQWFVGVLFELALPVFNLICLPLAQFVVVSPNLKWKLEDGWNVVDSG